MTKKELTVSITKRMMVAFRYLYINGIVKSRKEFCEAIGSNVQSFAGFDRGERCCTIENVYYAGERFGISLDWLFYNKGDMMVNG